MSRFEYLVKRDALYYFGEQVRKYLLRLETDNIHVKVWRPGVLLLVGSPKSLGKAKERGEVEDFYLFYWYAGAPNLIEVTNSLKKGGLFILATILVGEWKLNLGYDFGAIIVGFLISFSRKLTIAQQMWAKLIKTAKWKAFLDIIISPSIRLGVQNLVLVSQK